MFYLCDMPISQNLDITFLQHSGACKLPVGSLCEIGILHRELTNPHLPKLILSSLKQKWMAVNSKLYMFTSTLYFQLINAGNVLPDNPRLGLMEIFESKTKSGTVQGCKGIGV